MTTPISSAPRRRACAARRAVDWRLIDELVPRSRFTDTVTERARAFAEGSDRPAEARGIALTPLDKVISADRITYPHLDIVLDRSDSTATVAVGAPNRAPPADRAGYSRSGRPVLAAGVRPRARRCDHGAAVERTGRSAHGVFKSTGDPALVAAADQALLDNADDWLVRETMLYLKRVLKRIDVSSRSLITLVEPGKLLRRHAGRADAGGRPGLHARRHLRGRQRGGDRRPQRHEISARFPCPTASPGFSPGSCPIPPGSPPPGPASARR